MKREALRYLKICVYINPDASLISTSIITKKNPILCIANPGSGQTADTVIRFNPNISPSHLRPTQEHVAFRSEPNTRPAPWALAVTLGFVDRISGCCADKPKPPQSVEDLKSWPKFSRGDQVPLRRFECGDTGFMRDPIIGLCEVY